MIAALALGALVAAQAWNPPVSAPSPTAAIAAPALAGGLEGGAVPGVVVPQQVVPFGPSVNDGPPPALAVDGQVQAAGAVAPSGAAGADYVTRDEMQAEFKKWSWRKGEVTVVPYGTLWGSMAYDTQRSYVGDYALWIQSPTTHPHEDGFSVDAKSTRVGIDVIGPPLPMFCDAKVGGKVEIDFQGQWVYRNKSGVLLRHAYFEIKNDEYRILVGQTWDVISPLGIPTLNYTAGSAVGNLAYRRAQFRLERYYAVSDCTLITWQGSANMNVVSDFQGSTDISADPGPYPDLQTRVAFTLGRRDGPDAKPVVIGLGGHIGEQDFDFRPAKVLSLDRRTWSIDADFVVPITERVGFQGEFFTGENLFNYMGGILQGIDPVTRRGIRATGGWFDVYCDWRPDLHTHTGYAIDDPYDRDLTAGRACNSMIFSNIIHDVTKNLQVGFEVDVWQTLYKAAKPADTPKPGEAIRFEFAAKYKF